MNEPRLLERERELSALAELIEEVKGGSGRTIVVEGQPGLGKSGLLTATIARAQQPGAVRVLAFACGELEHDLPWAAATGLLAPAVTAGDTVAQQALFAGAAAPAAVLFDGLPATPPARTADDPDLDGPDRLHGEEDDPFVAVRALFVLVARLAAAQPLLLVVDDLHWCDRPSLEFLAYLQRRLAWHPIGLVLAQRPAPAGVARPMLERIAAAPETDVYRLEALGVESVATLLHGHGFARAGAQAPRTLWEVTAGNPFYLHELLIELDSGEDDLGTPSLAEISQITPPSVLRSLLVRLQRLDPDAGALARAAAVLGDGGTLRHAAALADLAVPAAAAALDALAGAHLLAAGEPLRFIHPLVRTAIYSEIPAARRARDHGRAAALLAAEQPVPEIVALHLLHAPRRADPGTVETLRAAAERARAHGAPEPAVRYLRRAIEEPPPPEQRPELLVELARAETAIGATEAPERLRTAIEMTLDERRRAEILLELGWLGHHAGRFAEAAEAFEQGLATAAADSDPELAAELEAGYLVCATLIPERAVGAVQRIREIESQGGEIRSPAHRMLLAQVLFMRTMASGPRDEILELAHRIWAKGELLREEGAESHALWHVIGALSWADDYATALSAADQVIAAAAGHGWALAEAQGRYARSWPNYWMGRLREAQGDAQAAIDIWHGGLETYLPAAVYWFGRASIELGEPGRAERALSLVGDPERWRGTGMIGFIHALEGYLHAHGGRMREAAACQLACGEVMESLLITNPGVMPWRSAAAVALRAAGETERALGLARAELELARACGGPRAIGVGLIAVGVCTPGPAGIECLTEAVEALEGCGARLEHARALIELGAAIRRGGRRRDARTHLQAGIALAQDAGAVVLARYAETELRAAGARPRRATETGRDVLTASERRAAELAALGHTNRAIAVMLQVSVKAVEWHLHQAYRKLDISGRRQLPSALGLGENPAIAS
jgi:tetratricopeptide (TPR) repeat protein